MTCSANVNPTSKAIFTNIGRLNSFAFPYLRVRSQQIKLIPKKNMFIKKLTFKLECI